MKYFRPRLRRWAALAAVLALLDGVAGTVAGQTIQEFPTPAAYRPYGITTGPDGALWFSENEGLGLIGRVTNSGTSTDFSIPISLGAGPAGIAVGSDGALWFTFFGSSGKASIGRITTGGSLTEFAVPTPTAQPGQTV